MEQKYLICEHCKNIINFVENKGVPVMCCGQKMTELVPNTSEAATEKHIPVVTTENNVITINVGSVPHPMVDVHFIQWISVETNKGVYRIHLSPDNEPTISVTLSNDETLVNVSAYCNIHGLWASKQ